MLLVVCAQAVVSGLIQPARAQGGPAPLAAPCPALGGTFNRWTKLHTPQRPELAHVGSFAQDPCTLVGATADGALYRATDARTWTPAVELALAEVSGVATEDMPVGTAFVFGAPPNGLLEDGADPRATGLYVTRDFGVTFQGIPDLAGYAVSAVAAAPSDPQVVYATASASPVRGVVATPLVLKSSDFGRTWIPLPGSLPALPTRVAIDARLPNVVWTNASVGGTPATGVWRSLNGGVTFDRVRDETVLDFDTSPVPGGGSRVDMATTSGLLRTRDAGTTFRNVTDEALAAVTHETFAPAALMVVGDEALRSTTGGGTWKQTPGLGGVGDCTVSNLTRNEEFPSHFLLSLADCAAAGHYLYRSDGRDLANLEEIGGDVEGGYVPRIERLPRTEMRVLREIQLPVTGTNPSSDSLAFDGQLLYYTNNDSPKEIFVSTTTGELVRTLFVDEELWLRTLTYDPHLDTLWAVGTVASVDQFQLPAWVFKIDPVTGETRRMFKSPLDSETSLSMDPTEQVFRSYYHHGYSVYEVSMTGQIVDECVVPGSPVDPNISTNPDRGHPESTGPGFASGVAVGGGRMYLQLEDDRTIYHVSEDCELLSVFEHRRFAESGGYGPENDQLACDTVTFGQPAIWIRDANTNHAFAYAVPSGYCPIDSTVTMTPPKVTAKTGAVARACALLRGEGPGDAVIPVGGAELTFYAGDVPVATGVTDEEGFACASFDAPGPPAGTVPLEAAFFGSVSYRASSGTGILETFTPMTPDPKKPLPPPPPPPRAPQVVVIPPPPPLIQLPAAGGARPPQPPQSPQAQPQQQPQAQAQAGLARQQQQQTQLALAFSDETPELTEEFAMSERRERNVRLSLQGAAALVVFAFGWCMTRTSVAYRKVRR